MFIYRYFIETYELKVTMLDQAFSFALMLFVAYFWTESAIYTAYTCYLYKRYVIDTNSDIMNPPFCVHDVFCNIYNCVNNISNWC